MTAQPASGCGCPPTSDVVENGAVHHVIFSVTDLARSRAFYGWLMPRLGYPTSRDFDGVTGYLGSRGSFWIKQQAARFGGERFDKDRVGLCEVAFRAESRAHVDALHRALVERGVTVLD